VRLADGYLAHYKYPDLTPEQKAEICNGMGAETSWWNRIIKWLIPDHFFGLDMTECGNIHDHMYHTGGSLWDKIVADLVFLFNMCWRIHFAGKKYRFLRYFMATRYFLAVLWGGKSSFNLKDPQEDN
jgi:hypothetical protein